jgi:DNA polymerase I
MGSVREFLMADCEFFPEGGVEGGRPVPVCLVAEEYYSGKVYRLWHDELNSSMKLPFDIGPNTVLVAYFASAEGGCLKALGLPLPHNVLDLFTEFRCKNNGGSRSDVRSLREVMLDANLPFMSEQHKEDMRKLILTGDWTLIERKKSEIFDYCQEDMRALRELLRRRLKRLDMPRALLRGRYMMAASVVEHYGIPVDMVWWKRFLAVRKPLLSKLITEWDRPYQVYGKQQKWSYARFGALLRRLGITDWAKTESGRYFLEKDYFKDMCRIHPELEGLRQLKKTIRLLQEPKLAIGLDGRNRAPVAGFGATSGRNAPRAAKFLPLQARCLRGMIRPTEGMALGYVDWEAQEIAVAAALSRDPHLLQAYLSGDPYLYFAKAVGLVPADATKSTHGTIRDICKTLMLGINYGMSVIGLAKRLKGIPNIEKLGSAVPGPQELMRLHEHFFKVYWDWSRRIVEKADLRGFIQTMFGWRMQVTDKTTERTLMNFPMQATGAEMMRIACIALVEKGIRVCGILHDAFLIEAPTAVIGAVTALAEGIMQYAGYRLLDIAVRTEAKIIPYPHSYFWDVDRSKQGGDAQAANMWDDINRLMAEVEEPTG